MTITLVTDSNTWQYWQEEWNNRGKEVNPKHKASPDWSPGIDVIFLFLCLVRVVVRGEVYVRLKLVNCALGQNWLSEIFVHFQKINSENWFGSTDRLMVWFSKNKQTSSNYHNIYHLGKVFFKKSRILVFLGFWFSFVSFLSFYRNGWFDSDNFLTLFIHIF